MEGQVSGGSFVGPLKTEAHNTYNRLCRSKVNANEKYQEQYSALIT